MATKNIQVEQALDDQLVETIDDLIEIHNMNDLFLVMDLPNLKKANFYLFIYREDDKCKKMCINHLHYHPDMEESLAMWMLIVEPALGHYEKGCYMTNKGLIRHERSLQGTDFTFQGKKRSGEKISVRYVDSKITTKTNNMHEKQMIFLSGNRVDSFDICVITKVNRCLKV